MKTTDKNFTHGDMSSYLINLIGPVLDKCRNHQCDLTFNFDQNAQAACEAFTSLNDVVNDGGNDSWKLLRTAWTAWRNLSDAQRNSILLGWEAPLRFPTLQETGDPPLRPQAL